MQALATASGASSWQTVQQWEKEGGTAPKRARLEKVAKALNVSPEWLVWGEENEFKAPALQFTELNGLEAQLVMIYRTLDDDRKRELLVYANSLVSTRN